MSGRRAGAGQSEERRFHNEWLGMVQPAEGLVVSPSVLERAQTMQRLPKAAQHKLIELCPLERCAFDDKQDKVGKATLQSLPALLEQVLDLTPDLFDGEGCQAPLPEALSLYVPEGGQTLAPTLALKQRGVSTGASVSMAPANENAQQTDAARAGNAYAMLIWQVPTGLDLDKPETHTGSWDESAQVKFDRLLRECQVPIGLLSNSRELRLVYAPQDSASGWLPFRLHDLCQTDGRAMLDALALLLRARRWFGVAPEHQLPALLRESRLHQSEVTNELAQQVFEALEILLAGFEGAAELDAEQRLHKTLEVDAELVYAGLLTVLLRVVFLLYCEDHGLMPTESELFSGNYSVTGLYEELQADADRYPDSMHLRYGAYARLVGLFRLVYLGGKTGGLGACEVLGGLGSGFDLPERRDYLFNPSDYPFLEGWGPGGSAPIASAARRQAVDLPRVDDATIFRMLQRLVVLDGQRLSYRSLRVEQIGSVYEGLMGYRVEKLDSAAVRLKLASKKGAAWVWLSGAGLLAQPASQRGKWLQNELGFDKAMAGKLVKAVKGLEGAQVLDALAAVAGKKPQRAGAGRLVLQPGPERRRTSSHYTPPELARSVVVTALEPLLQAMGPEPKSESLLNLVVCDPAMGSGAFLVSACEYLAEALVAAWAREGKQELTGKKEETALTYAKRLVAQRCLFGVDKNRYAVRLARLSLWLTTISKHEPFTFVDHALRHGDSLVGLSLEQLRAFHWQQTDQLDLISARIKEAIAEGLAKRRQILDLAEQPGVRTGEKQKLLFQAQDALADLRLVADVLLGAFFAEAKPKAREAERLRRRDVVERWLLTEDDNAREALREELVAWQKALHAEQVPFHWPLEYPEVFCDERADPLDGDQVNGAAMVDAFVGNPPFSGQAEWSAHFGAHYKDWLYSAFTGVVGKCDLSAFFFRTVAPLIGRHGTIGLISSNTISQGDTRESGLAHLVAKGFRIYCVESDRQWAGAAAVTTSYIHLGRGNPVAAVLSKINGAIVSTINSRLDPREERNAPGKLANNAKCSFLGCKIAGQGFLLTPEKASNLIVRDAANEQRIFPYLGGEEVNTSPTQSHNRFVIDFFGLKDAKARQWVDLFAIVQSEVKPYRDGVKRAAMRDRWWLFAENQPSMRAAIAPLQRCLVTSRVTKHLSFSFQPTNRIFSEALYVFPLDAHCHFATLQSRLHEVWARLLSSSMKTDLRYAASDCFETFPFPQPDPRTRLPALESIGCTLYEARAAYMLETDQGLTKTYNALKDPECTEERIVALRRLHEQLDEAVLVAYGWSDLAVPPFCTATPADEQALQAFRDEVIDRLFVLNAERAGAEQAGAEPTRAQSAKPKLKGPRKAKPRAPAKPAATKTKKRGAA